MSQPKRSVWWRLFEESIPWLLVTGIGAIGAYVCFRYLNVERGVEPIVWRSRNARWLLGGAIFVGLVLFHLHRHRAAAMGFSQVDKVTTKTTRHWFSDIPSVLR